MTHPAPLPLPLPLPLSLSWALLAMALAHASCGVGPLNVVDSVGTDVGLVAYWSFNEGTGTAVPDHSGNGLDGVLTGGTWIGGGPSGGALYLARGDFVTVPGFPDAAPDWTVSAWIRYAATDIGSNLATIVSTEIPSTGGWELQGPVNATTSELQFSYSPAGHYNTIMCCEIQPDRWMHITAVVDSHALTMTLYLGGTQQALKLVPNIIVPGNRTLHIGIEQTLTDFVWPLQAAVDEIRIYKRALTAVEVSRLDTQP